MPHVFLNPGGGPQFGLIVIVEASTGVTYAHQCGGHANDHRVREGFLVPVGGVDAARPIYDWFRRNFRGNCYPPVEWTGQRLDELAALIGSVPCWSTPAGPAVEDRLTFLSLDTDRLDECVEAWIPVTTPYGKGILVLENSD